jgi:phenylalanyl-tRNA synthetase alpha chain
MNIEELKKQSTNDLAKIKNLVDLEQYRIKYLGRKGEITAVLRSLKDLPAGERKKIGIETNELKKDIGLKLFKLKNQLTEEETRKKERKIDVTAPGIKIGRGHLHPMTLIARKIEEIFQSMGFKIVEGPDIETEHYNFDALNIPKNHPARDAWSTFWLKTKPEKLLLRAHTSPMQVRFMEKNNPPLRIIVPGRCFRYDATDPSHSHTFYQLEGLMVDRHTSFGNLKAILEMFIKRLYGEDAKIRWQPSYFPFVEPGLELLLRCTICGGKGCPTCGNKGWIELIPCGMVHPNVLKAAGYVPGNWQGFAFGMGVDRITMMKYRINDIRLLYSGDLHFLNQF